MIPFFFSYQLLMVGEEIKSKTKILAAMNIEKKIFYGNIKRYQIIIHI